jgi:hypothetical protein
LLLFLPLFPLLIRSTFASLRNFFGSQPFPHEKRLEYYLAS